MVRVRFAPSPTGVMHLGNIRTALLNFLYARQKAGTFVLRIEDTDAERNFDPQGKKIIQDLEWLGLTYDEGPNKDGGFGPYMQSERMNIYAEKLNFLREQGSIYRCFCTKEELEKKRKRQIALKQPPRYDQTCLQLSTEQINEKLDANIPYIWRMKIDHGQTISIQDIAHGTMTFDLKNFSDFPVTRADGSFTFMFANCVDDILMKITHVLRGEDHLTNTVGQVVIYQAFGITPPCFWHQPILANIDGKKLSKRDFGFSLNDLKDAGFLPQAIVNYLGIIGASFDQEILSLEELTKTINFEHQHASGLIKYDVEKLRWVNHKWIEQLETSQLMPYIMPFIIKDWPQAKDLSEEIITQLIDAVKTDVHTLSEIPAQLTFYFNAPQLEQKEITAHIPDQYLEVLKEILTINIELIDNPQEFLDAIKKACKEKGIPFKVFGAFTRLALTGKPKGLGLSLLLDLLDSSEIAKRFKSAITHLG